MSPGIDVVSWETSPLFGADLRCGGRSLVAADALRPLPMVPRGTPSSGFNRILVANSSHEVQVGWRRRLGACTHLTLRRIAPFTGITRRGKRAERAGVSPKKAAPSDVRRPSPTTDQEPGGHRMLA